MIFSCISIEMVNDSLKDKFKYDQNMSLPIGFIFGMIGGAINEVLRENSGKYNIVLNNDDPFNHDI